MNGVPKKIVVRGEPTIDWFTLKGAGGQTASEWKQNRKLPSACYSLGGGALLLTELLNRARPGSADGPGLPRACRPGDDKFHHAYANIRKFEHPQAGRDVWAVDDFLGFTEARSDKFRNAVSADCTDADLVVVDDEGLGFRDHSELWPNFAGYEKWVVLKAGAEIASGPLWDQLYADFADRLIVVADIGNLRRGDMEVSKDLSWERTAQDLAGDLIHKPSVNALSRCAYVVVHFGPVGAFLLKGSSLADPEAASGEWMPEFELLFDPDNMEGDWETHEGGRPWGYTSVLTAAIALCVVDQGSPTSQLLEEAVRRGLRAMRELDFTGYHVARDEHSTVTAVGFPFTEVLPLLQKGAQAGRPEKELSGAKVRPPVLKRQKFFASQAIGPAPSLWTIIRQKYPPEQLDAISRNVVIDGASDILLDVPRGHFGKLLTVDRQEIEEFRSIRSLVGEYCRGDTEGPLSIAVFGAPGSGKSFSVLEVLKPVEGSQRSALGSDIKRLDFNLSQFSSPEELVHAFHLVRDLTLKRTIPVVFWDEFDTSLDHQQLGWLRYFLAPMQDGTFREGAVIHPIGRCIFVFAGGRSNNFDDFRNILKSDEEFRAAKGPDFLSRIRGYINIAGLDSEAVSEGAAVTRDPYFVLRRAITLRSLLWKARPDLFHSKEPDAPVRKKGDGDWRLDIDPGLLNAFLNISSYAHGVRSMEAIIEMSALSGKRSFTRSSLPPIAQLYLHVDGVEFLALTRSVDFPKLLDPAFLDSIAATLRENLRSGSAASELREAAEQDLTDFVSNIPNMLGDAGYRIVPARTGEDAKPMDSDAVTTIAQKEHARWMDRKIRLGWKCGTVTDLGRRIHRALMPWGQLPLVQQELEIEKVAAIPLALMKAEPVHFAVERYERDVEDLATWGTAKSDTRTIG